MEKELIITSPSFINDGKIPVKHTGFGENLSPELDIGNLDGSVKSIAVTMCDLNIPMIKEYCHWLIWNIPKTDVIPEGILPGAVVANLDNAVQGVGFGNNKYAGPKQPFFIRSSHGYIFKVFALDTMLDLPATAGQKALFAAMDGHILQTGSITGSYKRGE